MDFNLSPEHLLIRKMMAEFTENEVKPIAAETDAKTLYPRENIEKLFDLGVMGMCIPKEYGGQGADPLASAICIEELSKQCASTGDIVATHNGLCCDAQIEQLLDVVAGVLAGTVRLSRDGLDFPLGKLRHHLADHLMFTA